MTFKDKLIAEKNAKFKIEVVELESCSLRKSATEVLANPPKLFETTEPKLEHVTNLVVGDWSHDGHNISSTTTIKSNLTTIEIEGAYEKASKQVGIDLVEKVAENYRENWLLKSDFDKLVQAGFKFKLDRHDQKTLKTEGHLDIYEDVFVDIYLFLVKLGSENFQYEKIEDNTLNIGGYGLFDC